MPLIFTETGVHRPHFAETGCLDCVCEHLGATTFLLKKCLHPTPLKNNGSAHDHFEVRVNWMPYLHLDPQDVVYFYFDTICSFCTFWHSVVLRIDWEHQKVSSLDILSLVHMFLPFLCHEIDVTKRPHNTLSHPSSYSSPLPTCHNFLKVAITIQEQIFDVITII